MEITAEIIPQVDSEKDVGKEKLRQIEEIVSLWKITTPEDEVRQLELAKNTDVRLLDDEVITLIFTYIQIFQSSLSSHERLESLEELEQNIQTEIELRRPNLNQEQTAVNRKLFQEGKISFAELTRRNKEIFQTLTSDNRRLSNLNALSFVHHNLIDDLAEIKVKLHLKY